MCFNLFFESVNIVCLVRLQPAGGLNTVLPYKFKNRIKKKIIVQIMNTYFD